MNAVHNIHTHLNLNGNEVRNVRLEGLPSDPDPVEGGVYFNLETGEFRFSDGTAWKSLLGGFWKLDDDGNLVTDKTVIVPNLIVRGDLSTEAKGTDPGAAGGIIGVKVGDAEYTDITAGILDMTEAFEGLDVDVDLSDYYTNEETDAKIAESLIPYAKITDVGSTYATKASLETLQGEVDNIEAILGMDEEAEGVINTWNEVKAFLDGYSSSDDLAAILSTMNADIAKRALDSDLDTLAGRVGVNELAIADNAGNIKKNFDAIGVLESNKANWGTNLAHYGITDAYTKVNVDDLLKKYLLLEAESQTIKGNIRIEGNLIIAGDMSSEGTGGNSGADGTVIGVVVNGTQYADETNGMLDLSTLMNQYALATAIPTTLPASDVYPWAKKSSLALVDIPDLSSRYLSVNGGTITGALKINTHTDRSLILDEPTGEKYHHISFAAGGVEYARITSTNLGTVNELLFNGETLIHSGNIGSYNAGSATKLATARTIWGQSFDGTGNVSGNIYGGIRDFVIYGYDGSAAYNIIDADSNNKNLWIGYGSAPRSHDTSIAGKNVLLLYGESRNYGLILNSSGGNVTIGASDLAGTAFKLSVDGKTAIRATYRNGYPTLGSLSANSDFNVAYYDAQDGSQYGMYVSVNGYNGNSVIQAGRNDGITTAYNLLLNPLGGNVLIGTTTDSGYKLDVAGTARCGKNEDGADLLVFKMGREWRFQQSGEAASAALVLRTLENGKYFHLRNNANETAFTYVAQNSANRLYAYCPTEINSTFNVNGAVTMSSTLSVSKLTKLSNTTRYALEITTSANSHIMSFNGVDGNESAQIGYSSNGLYGFNYDAYRNDIRTHVTGFGISNDGIFYISPTGNPTTSNAYFKVASGGDVTIANNLIIAGDMSSTSDMRLKQHIDDVVFDLKTMAEMPIFTFRWKDGRDSRLHLGSSAQYWEKPAPWLVMGDSSKTLNYAVLGVAGIKSIAVTTVDHETRIKMLERKVNELETENRRLRYGN